jgi:hypothetical protein
MLSHHYGSDVAAATWGSVRDMMVAAIVWTTHRRCQDTESTWLKNASSHCLNSPQRPSATVSFSLRLEGAHCHLHRCEPCGNLPDIISTYRYLKTILIARGDGFQRLPIISSQVPSSKFIVGLIPLLRQKGSCDEGASSSHDEARSNRRHPVSAMIRSLCVRVHLPPYALKAMAFNISPKQSTGRSYTVLIVDRQEAFRQRQQQHSMAASQSPTTIAFLLSYLVQWRRIFGEDITEQMKTQSISGHENGRVRCTSKLM